MSEASSSGLYLDDIAPGQRFVSASHRVSAEDIKAFAGEFDPQPFHLDEDAAKDTFFGGLAASGWHVAAITMKLLIGDVAPFAGGIIGGGGEISWPKPTRPGDVLTVESEVLDVTPSRSRPERGMVTLRSETKNQRGETAQVLTARLVVPRRAAAQAGRQELKVASCEFSWLARARWAVISAAGWRRPGVTSLFCCGPAARSSLARAA
jgi:acyl dehydratase